MATTKADIRAKATIKIQMDGNASPLEMVKRIGQEVNNSIAGQEDETCLTKAQIARLSLSVARALAVAFKIAAENPPDGSGTRTSKPGPQDEELNL